MKNFPLQFYLKFTKHIFTVLYKGMQENNKFKSILKIVSSIGYLERLWMNQAYEEPLVFTSNKQSKLYFSQVSKYPCNSKMILTPYKYKKV